MGGPEHRTDADVVAASLIDLQRTSHVTGLITTASQKPLIAPLISQARRVIRSSLSWYMNGVLEQVNKFAENAVRSVGSSQVDPYSAVAAGVAALYGPLHGGANEAVLRMLCRIGSIDNVPSFIEGVKNGDERLMGFGHRVYKNYDPRAKIIKQIAEEVFLVTGRNPKLDIALELERIALEDEYFVKRKLYPNVDFYSGIVYKALGIPVDMFTAVFALARTVGWIAQWNELIGDPDQKIGRPRQLFAGAERRDFVPLAKRK